MTEAAAATPAPDPPRTQEELTAAQNVLLDRLAVLLEENAALARRAGAAAVSPEIVMALDRGWHRVADVQGELRELRAEGRRKLARRSLAVAWEIMQPDLAPAAAVPQPRPRRRSGSHRRHNPDQPPLWGLPSLVPVAAAVALRPLGAALRHSGHALRNPLGHLQAAHHAATAWTAAGVAGTATAAVIVASVVPSGPPAHASGSWPGTGSPAGITASATPVASSPAQTRRAATRPDLDAQHAGPDDPAGALPGSYAPPPSGPSAQGSPSVSVQVAGTLRVSTAGLDLGPGGGTATVTLTASGGPVDWHLVVPGILSASDVQGHLDDGASADITVSTLVSEVLGGDATLSFWPGRVRVAVKWEAPLPLPVDVPSAVTSVVPSPPSL